MTDRVEVKPWTLNEYNERSDLLAPFTEGQRLPLSREKMRSMAQAAGVSVNDVRRQIASDHKWPLFLNGKYQVTLRWDENSPKIEMVHLSIRHLNREPVHDWRDLQEIKNMVVGPSCEGLELYPSEDRVVDTANQYHLYVWTDPTFQLPFGFPAGLKSYSSTKATVQRPREPDISARVRARLDEAGTKLPVNPGAQK